MARRARCNSQPSHRWVLAPSVVFGTWLPAFGGTTRLTAGALPVLVRGRPGRRRNAACLSNGRSQGYEGRPIRGPVAGSYRLDTRISQKK